jgi:integrase
LRRGPAPTARVAPLTRSKSSIASSTVGIPNPCALITVEGANAKNRQTRHVPLNEEAVSVLRRWREQSGTGARIFNMATGFRTAWGKLLKRAQISQFRWHDLRHHFASRLVQRGVPLNAVRDLLGHSSIGMSLRYAHLAPDQRREAVAKLNEKPIAALTMRLSWDTEPTGDFYPLDFIGGKGGTRTLDPGIMRKKLPGKGP